MIPRKPASRKKATNHLYAINGPTTAPPLSEKTDQVGPETDYDMTMPGHDAFQRRPQRSFFPVWSNSTRIGLVLVQKPSAFTTARKLANPIENARKNNVKRKR